MKIAIAAGIILTISVLSVVAYQLSQTSQRGVRVEESALGEKTGKQAAVAEREESIRRKNSEAKRVKGAAATAARAKAAAAEAKQTLALEAIAPLHRRGASEQAVAERARASREAKAELEQLKREEGQEEIWEYGSLSWLVVGDDFHSLTWSESGLLVPVTASGKTFKAAGVSLVGGMKIGKLIPGATSTSKILSTENLLGILGGVGWELVQYLPRQLSNGFPLQQIVFKRKKS